MTRRLGAFYLLASVLLAACGGSTTAAEIPLARGVSEQALDPATTTTTSTTAPPETTTTTAPPPPTTTTTEAPVTAAAGRDGRAYNGLGTWIDVYDWSHTFGKDGPLVEPGDIDHMADVGVQTLYVQVSKWDAPTDILEPERLLPMIERARARGMGVVAWYLPTLEDPATDLRRLLAAAALPVDTIAVDIESRKVEDVGERNARLLWLSHELRRALPNHSLGAIPFPPVVMEVVNPGFWPGFPWAELAPFYDVWLPMSYWTDRTQASGYRDAYRYTAENIDRMRANLGQPGVPIHSIGGIAHRTSGDDVAGMLQACRERGCVGGSLYDWRTSFPELWPHLQPFRAADR